MVPGAADAPGSGTGAGGKGGHRQEEAGWEWGSFGGPGWFQGVGHTWEEVGVPADLWRSTSFGVRCLLGMEKGRDGKNTAGMSRVGDAPAATARGDSK